jgi:ribonuclease PH
VGFIEGELLLDLTYAEDQQAQVDFTVVMTNQGDIVEVHGATEGVPFAQDLLPKVITLAQQGLQPVYQMQREAILHAGG